MTATLALDTVEQAEAVLSGRQRYVRVPMVSPTDLRSRTRQRMAEMSMPAGMEMVCPACKGTKVDASDYPRVSICGRCRGEGSISTLQAVEPPVLVPDPSWVAAAKPCETVLKWNVPEEIEKGALVVEPPLIAVTAPCSTCSGRGWDLVRPIGDDPATRCPDCLDGRVSAGPVRVEGPLLEVKPGLAPHVDTPVGSWLAAWQRDLRLDPPGYEWIMARQDCDGYGLTTTPCSDQLRFLAPDGPDSLIGQFVVAVEVLA